MERNWELNLRLGRQRRSSGGLLGRFDGAYIGYQLTPLLKLNAVSSFPVRSSKDSLETSRNFFGLSLDLGTLAEAWTFSGFAIQQLVDGITDRQAIGAEVRYYRPGRTLFSLVDYDASYSKPTTFLTMELLEGSTLEELLGLVERLDTDEALPSSV